MAPFKVYPSLRALACLAWPAVVAPPPSAAAFQIVPFGPTAIGTLLPPARWSPTSMSTPASTSVPPHLASPMDDVAYSQDDGGLGAARAMLFNDQHRAMSNRADFEGELLDPNMAQMTPRDTAAAAGKGKYKKKASTSTGEKRKRGGRAGGGVGFGGGAGAGPGTGTAAGVPSSRSATTMMKTATAAKPSAPRSSLASALDEDGVVLVPGAIARDTAADLRASILDEIERMRSDVRRDPSLSVPYFYVPAEIHFSTPRGYVLLPLRDSASADEGPDVVGAVVRASRELLRPGSVLSDLFGEVLDGTDSELYDFCALRTEAGAARQVVHADTPYQEVPGLFCAFVALQDITFPMGGTLFIPGTHVDTAERRRFDASGPGKDDMLASAEPRYVLLKAGDAAVFDMRVLHAGLANLSEEEGGGTRIIWAVTFRNLNAKEELGHRPNLRPAYAGRYTLGSFQEELASDAPFVGAGNGLLSG